MTRHSFLRDPAGSARSPSATSTPRTGASPRGGHAASLSGGNELTNVHLKKWLNKIHHGDCLTEMNKMPSEYFDLIVTSPPYNLRNSTGGGMRNGGSGLWKHAGLLKGYADGNTDDMPYDQYVEWQVECLHEMMRLLKATGAIYYNHKWRVQDG